MFISSVFLSSSLNTLFHHSQLFTKLFLFSVCPSHLFAKLSLFCQSFSALRKTLSFLPVLLSSLQNSLFSVCHSQLFAKLPLLSHLKRLHEDAQVVHTHGQDQERHDLNDDEGGLHSEIGEKAERRSDCSEDNNNSGETKHDLGINLERRKRLGEGETEREQM